MRVDFYFIGLAACLLRIDDRVKIGIDPALAPEGTRVNYCTYVSRRLEQPKVTDGLFDNTVMWLFSSALPDHFDSQGAAVIDSRSQIITRPENAGAFEKCGTVRPLKWGEITRYERKGYEFDITAVPAYRGSNALVRKLNGPCSGYLLTIRGAKEMTIYFTGDTIYHKKVSKFVRDRAGKIHLMVANMGEVRRGHYGGPFTMSPLQLRQYQEDLMPDRVIPVHYCDMSHYLTTERELYEYGFTVTGAGRWVQVYDR